MFDILQSDIICFQETKIQRKDLRDDMVLVPGFDCYWSLPRYKKGYSGVVIYTRNEKCAPIRAEEGITGVLCPPNSIVPFRELDEDQQIGGYPTQEQIREACDGADGVDPTALDAEGRCVILEFPAFVLLGTYCPAERDETRTHFRTSFLKVLDARIRNLVKMGKRVVWIGDMNISREEIDTATAEETMRKKGVDPVDWISTPSRRLFNQLLVGGKVYGEKDEGREDEILWDVCRGFHEARRGMYTCWETRVNARPGNYGSRIDYVLCSHEMKDWWEDSNIQEGLLGSDHCPVYGSFKEKIVIEGQEKHILDLVNPPGMYENGTRKMEWSAKNLLPMSGKLIQEFDRRRNIRDMFSKKPTLPIPATIAAGSPAKQHGSMSQTVASPVKNGNAVEMAPKVESVTVQSSQSSTASSKPNGLKRSLSQVSASTNLKKAKTDPNGNSKGQKSLSSFFTMKQPRTNGVSESPVSSPEKEPVPDRTESKAVPKSPSQPQIIQAEVPISPEDYAAAEAASFESRKSWGKLFSKPVAPKCEHVEPCKTMLTKKPGVNCGRSFWMCARPLGPGGKQERGTQWRCNTFIWASDWDARGDPG